MVSGVAIAANICYTVANECVWQMFSKFLVCPYFLVFGAILCFKMGFPLFLCQYCCLLIYFFTMLQLDVHVIAAHRDFFDILNCKIWCLPPSMLSWNVCIPPRDKNIMNSFDGNFIWVHLCLLWFYFNFFCVM